MEIIRGKIESAKKVVVYGPEGIGKSTFASKFPNPLYIDTEGSTKDMDVARMPKPSSWTMLKMHLDYVVQHPEVCRTLVIDTVDWAEQMCVEDICSRYQKKGIEDFGYGTGYVYVKEEFGRFLNKLEEVIGTGIHVVINAHMQMRKFEQPDEMGAYDRYEMKLGKKTSSQISPLVKEWADMVLFANYKTVSIAVDDKGKKHKAQGGKRVMYTQHHPCWDAKNRYNLAEQEEFDYAVIAHIIEPVKKIETPKTEASKIDQTSEVKEECSKETQKSSASQNLVGMKQESKKEKIDERIPAALRDLMLENDVYEWDIQNVVAARGYFTADIPIFRYEEIKPGFINGVLVGAWSKVFEMIKEIRVKEEIPFR